MDINSIKSKMQSEGYSDAQINQYLQHIGAAERSAPVSSEGGFSALEMLKNTPRSAWQFAKDITAPIHSPVQTFNGVSNLATGLVQKAIPGEQGKEQYADAVGQFITDRYGDWDKFKVTLQQDPVGVLSDLSTILTGGGTLAAKAPGIVGKIGNTVSKAGQVVEPVNLAKNTTKAGIASLTKSDAPSKMYESAAKFSTTMDKADRDAMVQTALDEKIMPTGKGVAKVEDLLSSLDTQINGMIEASTLTGQTVPRAEVFRYLHDLKAKLNSASNVDAKSDVAKMNKVADDWLEHLVVFVKVRRTPRELQNLKVDLYKKINFDVKQGKADAAVNQTRKAMARGAKDSISDLIPGISDINKRYGNLIELKDPLTRAANRIDNHNLIGIQTPLAIMTGNAAAGTGGSILGAMASMFDQPQVKAKSAILLNELKKRGFSGNLLDTGLLSTALQQGSYQAGRTGGILSE